MFTSPRLNALATVAFAMYGHRPTHRELVALYRALVRTHALPL